MSFLRKLLSRNAPRDPASEATGPEPQDDLERVVVDARTGRVPMRDLVERLFSSQVCVILNKEIPASGVWPPDVVPVTVTTHAGAELVAIYSNLQRAGSAARQLDTHKFCLQVAASWLLLNIPRRYGLVLNPGLPVTFEMTAEGLETARRDFGRGVSR